MWTLKKDNRQWGHLSKCDRRRPSRSGPQPRFPPRLSLATVKGKPATQAERDAITFKPIELLFPGTNEEWALNHLPQFRLALVMLSLEPAKLKESLAALAEGGKAPDFLESLCIVKQKFADMSKFMDVAISRSFLMLERLGYSPENPPPDGDDEGDAGRERLASPTCNPSCRMSPRRHGGRPHCVALGNRAGERLPCSARARAASKAGASLSDQRWRRMRLISILIAIARLKWFRWLLRLGLCITKLADRLRPR